MVLAAMDSVKLQWEAVGGRRDDAAGSAIRIWILMASEAVARPVKMVRSGVR